MFTHGSQKYHVIKSNEIIGGFILLKCYNKAILYIILFKKITETFWNLHTH